MPLRRASATALFLVLGLGVVHALAHVSDTLAPDVTARQFQDYEQQVGRLLDDADDITALSVGSSHSLAIDFPTLGEEGFHLWLSGGDVFEAVYLASTMAPRLPALQTVYVSLSYFSFAADNATHDARAVNRRQMYFSVPSHKWIAGDVGNFLRGKVRRIVPVEAIVRADHWSGVVKRVVFGVPAASRVSRDRFGQWMDDRYRECTSLSPEQLRRHAQSRTSQHLLIGETPFRAAVERSAQAGLTRLVADLHGRGVRVVLYTPPYSRPYNDRVPERLTRQSREMAVRVAASTGAHRVDLSEDSEFTNDPALFMNSDHLNRCGARQFSRALRDAVREGRATP